MSRKAAVEAIKGYLVERYTRVVGTNIMGFTRDGGHWRNLMVPGGYHQDVEFKGWREDE